MTFLLAETELTRRCRTLLRAEVDDFLRYYDLERHLFAEVSPRFRTDKRLSVFDFFCIVTWKANRAKSRVARRLLAPGLADLQSAVDDLVTAVVGAVCNKERLRVLLEKWGFRLPMASAILSVLYPDDFTVYDVRVCEMLGDFEDAKEKRPFERLWERYLEYVVGVRDATPAIASLRDKDRYLWGKSFAIQLRRDIEKRFES